MIEPQLAQIPWESQEAYHRFLEIAAEGIWILDPEDKIQFVNQRMAALLGYPVTEILGTDFFEFVAPADQAVAAAYLQRCRQGTSERYEFKFRHQDGADLWVTVSTRSLFDADGTYQGAMSIATIPPKQPHRCLQADEFSDQGGVQAAKLSTAGQQLESQIAAAYLEQRQQAEEALRQSEAKFRNLVEQTSDWIWEIDCNGIFTYVSPQAEEIIGYSPAEILGKTTSDFMLPEEGQRFIDLLTPMLANQKPFIRLEKTLIHRNGQPVVLETSGSPILDSQGTLLGYRGIARYITECKQAEAQVQQLNQALTQRVAQLEAANQELNSFSYSVSHDLRTPLRAMQGFSRILLEQDASLSPQTQHYLNRVQHNTQRMGDLIDDLLSFSRLSRQPILKQLVRPNQLVSQVLADLQQAQNQPVEILLEELPVCEGDPFLLKQVWMNLLANALKFTSHEPAAEIKVGCQQTPNRQIYFVKDNGVGFDMNYAHKLFGVFQRLHCADHYEGTGVGLAIAQRIIHRHGGRIWAEGAVNQGATFYFTLNEAVLDEQ